MSVDNGVCHCRIIRGTAARATKKHAGSRFGRSTGRKLKQAKQPKCDGPVREISLHSPDAMGWTEGEPPTTNEEFFQNARIEAAGKKLDSLLSFYNDGGADEVLLHSYYDTATKVSTEPDPDVAPPLEPELVSAHAIESLWLARAWPDVGGHRRRKCAELIELYLEPSLVDYEGARHKYKSHRRVFDSMTQELKAIVAEQALTGPERCARSYFGVLGLLCRIVALGC